MPHFLEIMTVCTFWGFETFNLYRKTSTIIVASSRLVLFQLFRRLKKNGHNDWMYSIESESGKDIPELARITFFLHHFVTVQVQISCLCQGAHTPLTSVWPPCSFCLPHMIPAMLFYSSTVSRPPQWLLWDWQVSETWSNVCSQVGSTGCSPDRFICK